MKFSDSLKKNREFQAVYREKNSFANRLFIMYVKENGTKQNRIGISVSKKVGNSVVRHRLTRLVREVYRLNEDAYARGIDLVIVARPYAKDADFHAVESAIKHLSGLHHIISESEDLTKKGS